MTIKRRNTVKYKEGLNKRRKKEENGRRDLKEQRPKCRKSPKEEKGPKG